MLNLASPEQLFVAARSIRASIDSHEPRLFTNSVGKEFHVFQIELDEPRSIGKGTAQFLRLFKGLGGNDVVAGALYSHLGLDPFPETGIAQEIPLRDIVVMCEGATYTFNGSCDARTSPLPGIMIEELLTDLESAS